MKKISIEEADKILAAHRPKETSCPYCGVNLQDRMIPITKVKALLEKAEKQIPKTKSDQWNSWDVTICNLIYHLKELLPKEDEK